jgi:hypothetical protein
MVIDRGRLVREAIAVLLADLDARGKDSLLARRIGINATPHARSGQEAAIDGGAVNGGAVNGGTANGGAAHGGAANGTVTDDTGDPIPSLTWRKRT